MINAELSDLNFREMLNYGGQPIVKSWYDPPLKCEGYCIHCEQNGVFSNAGDGFDQMSHGCDTFDYEKLLGKQKHKDKIDFPIVFLLENPGGDYGNGKIIPFMGYNKQPPVNTYYWAPDIDKWPKEASKLDHYYSPYFAYLMQKHHLANVYITNLIKCNIITSRKTEYNKSYAVSNCVDKWLRREMEIFLPKVVFCFGRFVSKKFKEFSSKYNWNVSCVYMYHPSAIYCAQRYHKTREQMVLENDIKIKQYLKVAT